jgi:hypothetical protein
MASKCDDAIPTGAARAIDAEPRGVSRRFFVGLTVSAAGAVFLGCGSSSDAAGAAGAGGGGGSGGATAVADDVPFGVWEKLRTAVRGSPDHLVAESDRLVAAKDAKGLFELVRDRIATYPPSNVDGAVTEIRWGTRGTLRGGAGTPREKAELLAELYSRAGFTATVVMGDATPNPNESAASRAYLHATPPAFAPQVDAATLATWTMEMAQTGTPSAPLRIDADDAERQALVAALSKLLPKDAKASLGSYEATLSTASVGLVPLVAFSMGGKTTYACPMFADATFGASMTDETPVPAKAISTAPAVVVDLAVATSADPMSRISVAKGTYGADELAGRQILIQFAPATDLDTLSRLRFVDIHAFKAVLSVRGADVDPDAQPSFVVVGSAVTTRGEVVETAPDGTVSINGKIVFSPSDVDPGAAKKVASMSILAVRAGSFPTVSLDVAALDAGGQSVSGLPASAFRVMEGGTKMGFAERAHPGKLRVMFLVDADDPLSSGETTDVLAAALAKAVFAAHPGSSIVTGAYGVYVDQIDPAAVAAAATGDTDFCWSELADGAAQAPNVIVMLSDFNSLTDPNDPSNPATSFRSIIAAGPPVIALGNDPSPVPSRPELDDLVALTGGIRVPNGGVKEMVDAVLGFLDTHRTGATYTLTYTASVAGPSLRNVTTSVGTIAANGSYTVPVVATQTRPAALTGIYLTVSVGDTSVTRVVAGYAGKSPPPDGTGVPQDALDDVASALFGITLLSFEAGAPTLSTRIDDILGIKLAMKPLWQAVAAKDSAKTRDTLPTLRTYVPAELMLVQCALGPPSSDSVTFELGLRVVAYSNRPRFGVGGERHLDILPLGLWCSVADDAGVSFRATLARTARVAVVEGHAFPKSTLTALAGKSLSLLPSGGVDPTMLPYGNASTRAAAVLDEYSDWYRILPDGPDFVGFWAVDKRTGTLLGVLPDGSGGAGASAECNMLGDINKAFDALGLLAELGGMSVLGPFFFLGKQVAAIALLSAAILDNQDVGQPISPIDGLAANAACEAGKLGLSTAAPAFGKVGETLSKADAIGSPVDSPLINCPNALAGAGCKLARPRRTRPRSVTRSSTASRSPRPS